MRARALKKIGDSALYPGDERDISISPEIHDHGLCVMVNNNGRLMRLYYDSTMEFNMYWKLIDSSLSKQ